MHDGVDPPRHPAHHHGAPGGDPRREQPGGLGAVRRVVAAPYHGGGRAPKQPHVAPSVQQRRGIGNLGEERGKPRVAGNEHRGTEAIERFEDGAARGGRRAADRRRGGAGESGQGGDGAVRRVQRAGGALEGGDERAQSRRPDPRHLGERQVGR